jgi:hypothetical protein
LQTVKGSTRGPIENKVLAKKIMSQRKLKITASQITKYSCEPQDYYLLSKDFWCMFQDRYGCDLTVQLRRFDSVESMLPFDFKTRRALFRYLKTRGQYWFESEIEKHVRLT